MATGGLTVGKSHAEGGIPMTVKDTGQKIEVEGGEIIINKKSASDTKKHTFDGQKLTKCEIASKINESDGNGVKIDCDSIEGKKYKFERGGKTQQLNELFEDYYKRGGFVNFIYPKDSLGFEKHELPQIRTGAKGMFAEYLDDKYKRPMTSQIIVKASTLKPVQNKINTKQLEKIEEYGGLKKGKPITISNDGYVIDGHHRWYYATQKGLSLPALRIDLPATKVIEESFNSGLAEKESIESVRGAFADGGKVSREYSTKEIPINLYRSFFQDTDSDGVPNVDDVAPFNPDTKEKLEEVSLSDEMKTIINYRNDFENIRKQVVSDLEKITVECDAKGDCGVLSRTKTPYSIINKLRRRSLTNVKDLDKLDEKAKQKLKEKDLTGLDLYKGLTDVVGAMVVTPDKKNADKIRDVINSGRLGRVLEFEDFYKNDNNGYRAYHFLIAIEKDGKVYPVEIQVKTKRVKRLAGLSHTVYKNGNLNAEGFDKLNQLALKSDMGDVKAQKEFDEIVSNRKKVMGMIAKKTMAKGGVVSENDKNTFIKHARNYLKQFFDDEEGIDYKIEEDYLPNLKKLDDKTYQVEHIGSAGSLFRTQFRLTNNSLKEIVSFEKNLMDKNPKWEKFLYAKGGEIRSVSEIRELKEKIDKKVDKMSPKEMADTWNKTHPLGMKNPMAWSEKEVAKNKKYFSYYLKGSLLEDEMSEKEYLKYFAKGGEVSDLKMKLDKLDPKGNTSVLYDQDLKEYYWEDYKNDIYRDGYKSEKDAYNNLIDYLESSFAKGGEVYDLRDRLIDLGDEDFVEYEERQSSDDNSLYSTFKERLEDYHDETVFAKGGMITSAPEYHKIRNAEYDRRVKSGKIKDTDDNFERFDEMYFDELVEKGRIDPNNYFAKGGKIGVGSFVNYKAPNMDKSVKVKIKHILVDDESGKRSFVTNRGVISEEYTTYAKGGKMKQGYNDKLDESLGNTKGKRSSKEQNYKDRRNESEAMEKKGGKRKYARVKTMDKGNRKKKMKTPMTLAKVIRKEGEKWQDAVKRASAMIRKDS